MECACIGCTDSLVQTSISALVVMTTGVGLRCGLENAAAAAADDDGNDVAV